MLEIIKEEGKTEEEALNKILEQTKLTSEEIFTTTEFQEGKLFKGAKYIVSAIKKDDIKKLIEEFIYNLSTLMNIKIDSDILNREDTYNVTLVSDNNSILIGKEGKTLNAIQIMIRQLVKKECDLNLKINLDVANYKIKKMKNIEFEVKKIAKEVLATKIDVSLDPMNSYERRMVHSLIGNYDHLITESIGEGKERHIIIKYVEEK